MSSQDHSHSEHFENISPDPILGEERPLTRWQKFRMVVKVVELRLRFIALMAATGPGLWLLGYDLELLREVEPARGGTCRRGGWR